MSFAGYHDPVSFRLPEDRISGMRDMDRGLRRKYTIDVRIAGVPSTKQSARIIISGGRAPSQPDMSKGLRDHSRPGAAAGSPLSVKKR